MKEIRQDEQAERGDAAYIMPHYTQFYYKNAIHNCKHCYLDYMTNILYAISKYDNPEIFINRLDEVFDVNNKISFSINITDKRYINVLDKYYTLISCVAIPMGYGDGFQYHCTYFTNSKTRNGGDGYKKRLIKEGITVTTSSKKLNTPDKKDIVINVEKILSYKSKIWLKRYLEKLIS